MLDNRFLKRWHRARAARSPNAYHLQRAWWIARGLIIVSGWARPLTRAGVLPPSGRYLPHWGDPWIPNAAEVEPILREMGFDPVVGQNLIEALTSGMQPNPFTAYRERRRAAAAPHARVQAAEARQGAAERERDALRAECIALRAEDRQHTLARERDAARAEAADLRAERDALRDRLQALGESP